MGADIAGLVLGNADVDRPLCPEDALAERAGPIKGLRRHISDADEDVIVLKLIEQLDIAGYEIVKKQGNAGFTFETPGGDGSV